MPNAFQTEQWFLDLEGVRSGPYQTTEILSLIAEGEVLPHHKIATGLKEQTWITILDWRLELAKTKSAPPTQKNFTTSLPPRRGEVADLSLEIPADVATPLAPIAETVKPLAPDETFKELRLEMEEQLKSIKTEPMYEESVALDQNEATGEFPVLESRSENTETAPMLEPAPAATSLESAPALEPAPEISIKFESAPKLEPAPKAEPAPTPKFETKLEATREIIRPAKLQSQAPSTGTSAPAAVDKTISPASEKPVRDPMAEMFDVLQSTKQKREAKSQLYQQNLNEGAQTEDGDSSDNDGIKKLVLILLGVIALGFVLGQVYQHFVSSGTSTSANQAKPTPAATPAAVTEVLDRSTDKMTIRAKVEKKSTPAPQVVVPARSTPAAKVANVATPAPVHTPNERDAQELRDLRRELQELKALKEEMRNNEVTGTGGQNLHNNGNEEEGTPDNPSLAPNGNGVDPAYNNMPAGNPSNIQPGATEAHY